MTMLIKSKQQRRIDMAMRTMLMYRRCLILLSATKKKTQAITMIENRKLNRLKLQMGMNLIGTIG